MNSKSNMGIEKEEKTYKAAKSRTVAFSHDKYRQRRTKRWSAAAGGGGMQRSSITFSCKGGKKGMSAVIILLVLLLLLSFLSVPSHSWVAPLDIVAYKFFDTTTGESVHLKGVAYYPRPNAGELDVNNVDFFHDEFRSVWEPDIEYFSLLGINAVRIYAVDPGKDHAGFMCACAQAGIYVLVGLSASCVDCAITPDNAPDCYPPDLKARGQQIIGTFIKYDNLLGFDAGNEVDLTTDLEPWINAPCQKKFIRDMRAYIAGCDVRQVPVGLVIADIQRVDKSNYYNCYTTSTKDPYERANWLGLNAYQNCDSSVTELQDAAGYQLIIDDYSNYSIPLLMTEFGCLNPSFPTIDGFESQRSFDDARWAFEAGMKDSIAAMFVFEYSTENVNAIVSYPYTEYSAGNYGIGYYAPENCDIVNVSCNFQPKPEFYNLQTQYAATTTRGTYQRSTFSPPADRLVASPCPSNYPGLDEFTWEADSTDTGLFCPGVSTYTCPGAPASTATYTSAPARSPAAAAAGNSSIDDGAPTVDPLLTTLQPTSSASSSSATFNPTVTMAPSIVEYATPLPEPTLSPSRAADASVVPVPTVLSSITYLPTLTASPTRARKATDDGDDDEPTDDADNDDDAPSEPSPLITTPFPTPGPFTAPPNFRPRSSDSDQSSSESLLIWTNLLFVKVLCFSFATVMTILSL